MLAGSFAEHSQYFNKFAREHFPHLNLVMVDVHDPQRSQHIRDAVSAIAARPQVQAKLGSPEETQRVFSAYADELIGRIDKTVQQNGLGDPKSKTLAFYQTNYPSGRIVDAGGQISPSC